MAVDKRNLLLSDITETMKYKSSSHPIGSNYPPRRNYSSHAKNVSRKYESAIKRSYDQKQVAAMKMKGTYAEFSGVQNFELATKSLENRQTGIRLLNVKKENGYTKATVFIPEGKEDFFRKRIEAYASEKTKKGKPKNSDLIGSIEDIRLAMLESFWTDKPDAIPDSIAINCEIWLRYDVKKTEGEIWRKVEDEFHQTCDEIGVEVDRNKRILFPERIVKLIRADRNHLVKLLSVCEYLTEIRRATEPASFFTNQERVDQRAWATDLLSRCRFGDSNVSICFLDAGVNDQHPLLKPAILKNGLHSVEKEWGTEDNLKEKGHGTEMAGIGVYNDLQAALESLETVEVNHKIESVKILPKHGDNERELFGSITQSAVALAEIDNPSMNRVICMAVTGTGEPVSEDDAGNPTSWSAALDEIVSGAVEESGYKRLFLVSAGNVEPYIFYDSTYPEANSIEMVQDPGQSWNAVTVGGYVGKIDIESIDFKGFSALAPRGGLSPYSRTSVSWSSKWPVKPEVLFDGGNIATNGKDYDQCDDLSLLTTGFRPDSNLFSTIWATSAATAQAAYFSARLMLEYPEFWPETIRALMVHSAEWTDEMMHQFCPNGNKSTKGERRVLLRNCGYGIPDIGRAIQCAANSVNMIVQGEIQPYRKENGSVRMNEMHIHEFPWPKEELLKLGSEKVRIRVTLSYFIEPAPGEVGWKDRYRYPSCGLRFEINHTSQSIEEFKAKINLIARTEERGDDRSLSGSSGNNWFLGPNNRNSGSIHYDFISDTAANLCESKYVAVFPVGGWWKERPYLGKSESTIRYSLIVTVSVPEIEADIYTPIVNRVGTMIPIEI